MIIRKLHESESHGESGWFIALDGQREVLRFKPPEGFTIADVDRVRDYLLKVAREMEHGPS